jgi:hypothetical protein
MGYKPKGRIAVKLCPAKNRRTSIFLDADCFNRGGGVDVRIKRTVEKMTHLVDA